MNDCLNRLKLDLHSTLVGEFQIHRKMFISYPMSHSVYVNQGLATNCLYYKPGLL